MNPLLLGRRSVAVCSIPDELTDLVFPEPDPAAVDGDVAAHAEPRPVDRFRQTTAGTVVAAGLLGLRDALEGRPGEGRGDDRQ